MKNLDKKQIKNYIAGFAFSIVLTIIPYYLVTGDKLAGNKLIFALLGYAVLQLFVQLYYFLHLGEESRPRWNLMTFSFMITAILIIVLGSLWIMNNINYNTTKNPNQTENFIIHDEGFKNR